MLAACYGRCDEDLITVLGRLRFRVLRDRIKASLVLLALAASVTPGGAAEIRPGALMQVKANSIWFDDVAELTRWQALKKSGNAAALAGYQNSMLGSRDAWQFLKPLTVKILRYRPQANRVTVEMKTPGRFEGLTMYIDADALER